MTKALLTWHLVFLMGFIALAPRVEASFVPSETTPGAFRNRGDDIEKLRVFLESKAVKERLLDLGFTAREAEAKLAALSERQIHDLATRAESLKVGGQAEGLFIGILIILLLIGVVLPLLGIRVWR
jgi:hypothetical protein